MKVGKDASLKSEYESLLRDEGISSCEHAPLGDVFEALNTKYLEQGNPEEKVIKKDFFNKMLSEEAKEVVKVVFDTPVELAQFVWDCRERQRKGRKKGSDNYRLSQHHLRQYLRYYGWKYLTIQRAFREIKLFLEKI